MNSKQKNNDIEVSPLKITGESDDFSDSDDKKTELSDIKKLFENNIKSSFQKKKRETYAKTK